MSYPDPAYRGERGEVSARLVPGDTPPDIDGLPRSTCTYLARGDSTGGKFGLYTWTFGPAVSGPDPHFHRTLAESFYVLDGVVSIHDGESWKDRTTGDLLLTGGARREQQQHRRRCPGIVLEAVDATEYDEFLLQHDNIWI